MSGYDTGNAPSIPLDALAALRAAQRLALYKAPGWLEDARSGYSVGEIVRDIRTGIEWEALSVTAAKALWKPRTISKTRAIAGNRHKLPTQAGSNQMVGSRVRHVNSNVALSSLIARYVNWFVDSVSAEVANANAITVRASIEYPAGTFYQLTKSGNANLAIAAGATGEFDPLTLTLPAGAVYFVNTLVDGGSGGVTPAGYPAKSSIDGYANGASVADYTNGGGTWSGGSFATYSAAVIIGVPATWTPNFVGVGDSILDGRNEVSATGGDTDGNLGYAARALGRDGYGFLHLGRASTTAAQWAGAGAMTKRLALVAGFGTHLINQLGRNDWGPSTPAPIPDLIANLGIINTQFRSLDFTKIAMVTSIPKTASSAADAYTSITEQSVEGTENSRIRFNNALRNGEVPLQDSCWDAAMFFETAKDSGIWPIIGGQWTNDGTHPVANGHNRGSAQLSVAQIL